MPRFAIYCRDKADAAQRRKDASPAHLLHVEKHLDRYWVAGPFKDPEGETIGSLLIIEAENVEDARKFIEQDPYYEADIWRSVHMEEFMAAAGEWIGGKIW